MKGGNVNEETKKIRETRKKLGWSVKEMADALGVAKGTLDHYEQGRKVPKPVMKLLDIMVEDNK